MDEMVLEADFLKDFRSTGLRSARIAMLVAVAFGFLIMIMFLIEPLDHAERMDTFQKVRVACICMLMPAAYVLGRFPNFSLRYYPFTVGLPTGGALLLLSGGAVWLAFNHPHRFPITCASIIFSYWLCYGFTRLPTWLVFSFCFLSTLMFAFAALKSESAFGPTIILHLLSANVLGVIGSKRLEASERKLFANKIELDRLVSDLSSRERESIRLIEEKSRLIGFVSHDLTQPIAGIGLYLGLLRKEMRAPRGSNADGLLKSIDACLDGIQSNLGRLIDPYSGAVVLSERENDIGTAQALVEKLALVYERLATKEGVRFKVRMAKLEIWCMQTDMLKIWSVFSNLLSNSLRYRKLGSEKTKPWILLNCRKIGNHIRFDVVDNGIGIGREFHAAIFEPNVRLANSSGIDSDGYGLGLASVRSTLGSLPGHKLTMWSEVGRGTRFSVYVPFTTTVRENNRFPEN